MRLARKLLTIYSVALLLFGVYVGHATAKSNCHSYTGLWGKRVTVCRIFQYKAVTRGTHSFTIHYR